MQLLFYRKVTDTDVTKEQCPRLSPGFHMHLHTLVHTRTCKHTHTHTYIHKYTIKENLTPKINNNNNNNGDDDDGLKTNTVLGK